MQRWQLFYLRNSNRSQPFVVDLNQIRGLAVSGNPRYTTLVFITGESVELERPLSANLKTLGQEPLNLQDLHKTLERWGQ